MLEWDGWLRTQTRSWLKRKRFDRFGAVRIGALLAPPAAASLAATVAAVYDQTFDSIKPVGAS